MIQNGANIESGLVRGTLAAIGALIEVDEVDANLWKKQGEVSLHAAVGRRKTHILGFLIAVELSEACMVEIMELEHSCRIWRM